MQYRFGLNSKIELEYPKEKSTPVQAFSYSHYFRARVDETEISFASDDFEYTVFDTFNGEEKRSIKSQGVTVISKDGKKTVTLECAARAKADFGILGDVLPNSSN